MTWYCSMGHHVCTMYDDRSKATDHFKRIRLIFNVSEFAFYQDSFDWLSLKARNIALGTAR